MLDDTENYIDKAINDLIFAKQENDNAIVKTINNIKELFYDADLVDTYNEVCKLEKYMKVSMNLYDTICKLDETLKEGK